MQENDFFEDDFDLDAYKAKACSRTRCIDHNRQTKRYLTLGRVLIALCAFLLAYWLYSVASAAIMQYEYNKYHTASANWAVVTDKDALLLSVKNCDLCN